MQRQVEENGQRARLEFADDVNLEGGTVTPRSPGVETVSITVDLADSTKRKPRRTPPRR